MLTFSLLVAVVFCAAHVYVHRVPRRFWSVVLSLFYRRIHLRGQIPDDDIATLVVANHTNAFIDPFAVQVALNKPLIRTVRSDWLNHWLVKWLAKAVSAVPLARQAQSNSKTNRASFNQLNAALDQGKWVIVFPEGISHNRSRLRPFKKGAAHLVRQYLEATGKPIRVLQIGLYYGDKSRLHSEAWVTIAAERIYTQIDEIKDASFELSIWQSNIQASLPTPMRRKEQNTLTWVNSILPALSPASPDFLANPTHWEKDSQFQQMKAWLNSEGIDFQVLMRHSTTLSLIARLFADCFIFVAGLPLAVFGLLMNGPAVVAHYILTRTNSAAEDKWASSAFVIGIPLYPAYWLILTLVLPSVMMVIPLVILTGFYALFYIRTWRPRLMAMSTMTHCLLQPDIQPTVKTHVNNVFLPLLKNPQP